MSEKLSFHNLPKPVVAALATVAFGGGMAENANAADQSVYTASSHGLRAALTTEWKPVVPDFSTPDPDMALFATLSVRGAKGKNIVIDKFEEGTKGPDGKFHPSRNIMQFAPEVGKRSVSEAIYDGAANEDADVWMKVRAHVKGSGNKKKISFSYRVPRPTE